MSQDSTVRLAVGVLRLDGGTQPRAAIDPQVVSDYAVAMTDGVGFPPITVFHDGSDYWLADGFHRLAAAGVCGWLEIDADVRQGTRRDAVLFACGANTAHGLRRTNADKRRAVETLLRDEEWQAWSDSEIARRCGVSHPFVGNLRPHPVTVTGYDDGANRKMGEAMRQVQRGGKTYTMDISGLRFPVLEASVKAAAREVKSQERVDRVEARVEANVAALELSHPLDGASYRLLHADLRTVDGIADGTVSAIVTDPPYPHEFLPLYSDLSAFAARVLKPGGVCLVMVGQSYLEEVLRRLSESLTYQWTLAYLSPGASVQVFGRRVKSNWKPVVYLTNGPTTAEHVADVITSDAREKDDHDWQQSEAGMASILERFTVPGDLVCDPFCGAGTTGVSAVRLGRLFVGVDVDEVAIKSAAARLGG